jgi:hypothetical protein
LAIGPAPGVCQPVLTAAQVTDMRAASVADPFLFRHAGAWHLFFEAVNLETDRGELAYATSDDCLHWKYVSTVLREPFHLSYPQVFSGDDGIYMIPETRQAGEIRLYRAEEYPKRWIHTHSLLKGPYADATVFRHAGCWWLFAQRGLDELCLFWSAQLTGPWQSHPASPLFAGNRSRTRPGGRVLVYGNRLIRFAQDGWPNYGSRLRAFCIDRLDETAFEEHEVDESPVLQASFSGWNAMAMHHLDAVQQEDGRWLAAVDGANLKVI